MNTTERQYNYLQLHNKHQYYESQQTVVGDDANIPLPDWSRNENIFDSFQYSTGSEKYNRELEIDGTWAKIAQLSKERWSKENPY